MVMVGAVVNLILDGLVHTHIFAVVRVDFFVENVIDPGKVQSFVDSLSDSQLRLN